MASLADLLAARAAEEPTGPAVEVEGGGVLDYRGWHHRSDRLARGLSGAGLGHGDRIVLRFGARDWTEYAVAYAGVHKVGAVAVPVPTHVPGLELGRIVGHCGAAAVVAAHHRALPAAGTAPGPWAGTVADLEEGHDGDAFRLPSVRPGVAEVRYRSGPLLRPAATNHTEGAIQASLAAADAAAPATPRGGSSGPMLSAFAPGCDPASTALWFPLVPGRGPALHVPAVDADRFCGLASRRAATRWVLSPALALLLLESGALGRHDLSSLAQVVLAGRPSSPALLPGLAAALPGAALLSVVATAEQGAPAAFLYDPRPGSIGRSPRRQRSLQAPGPPFRAPAGPVEETVAATWELALDPARRGSEPIGVDDDFFERGGDELAAVRVLGLLHDAFEVDVGLPRFLEAPTVAALATIVEAARPADAGAGSAGSAGAAGPAPVAFSQEGMLWQEQFVPGSQNLPPLARRYRGPLRVEALRRALEEIVRRHEPLRSTFERGGDRLLQVVAPPGPLDLVPVDVGHLGAIEQEEALTRVLAAARRPFDLVSGPLFEPTLVRLGPDDHVLVFRVHHSVYDDWSVGVFRRELSALYAAFAAGRASPLPEPPVSFTAFARAQRRRLAGPTGAAQLAYWRQELARAPLCLQLPVDDPDRPEGASQTSAEPVALELPAPLVAGLRRIARRERATFFQAALAAFSVLLRHYTGQTELLLASVVANRNRAELERLVGCFTKKILLRLSLDGDPSFTEVLSRTRAAVLGALPHQDLPFETVLQATLGPAAAAHGLVPQVAVMFQGVTPQPDDVVLPGVATSGYDTSATTRRTHFASGGGHEGDGAGRPWGGGLYLGTFVILSLDEGSNSDKVSLTARGAFHRAGVERLLATFRTTVAAVVAEPSRPVSELSLLDDAQQAEVLDRWNGARVTVPDGRLEDMFSAQAARSPSGPAVVAGSRTTTWADLDARIGALAGRLHRAGVSPGSLVGVCLTLPEHGPTAFLGAWKAGAGVVALDPAGPDEHLASVIDGAGVEVVVVAGPVPEVVAGRARLVAADDDTPAPPTPLGGEGTADDVAVVVYRPAPSPAGGGIEIAHRDLANLLAGLRGAVWRPAAEAGGGRSPRVCLSAAPGADAFLRQLVALVDGHPLHVPGKAAIPALVGAGLVDLVDVGASEMAALLAGGLDARLRGRAGPPPPVFVVGSRHPLDGDLWRALQALPATVHHVWRPPDGELDATHCTVTGGGLRPTVGRPLANVGCYVLGPSGSPVPVGATGELYLGGGGLARGHRRGAPSAGGRLLDASLPGRPPARLLRTGQLARHLADGRIELLGAAAHRVELRGFGIDLSRIEAVLRRCPQVADVEVALEEDPAAGPRLVARVAAGPRPPTLADLRRLLWTELPGYAWPARMVLVGADGEETAPAGGADLAEGPFLGAHWAGVLGVAPIAAGENYWQSFSFLEAVGRATDDGVSVDGGRVSRNRTLATLAADLAAAREPGP